MIRLIALTSVLICASAQAVSEADAEKLLTMPLVSTDAASEPVPDADSQALDCLLTPSVETSIASPVVGVIDKVMVERGDLIRRGQVLVRLRSEVEQATLKLNQAQTEYGKRTIERNIGLYERNLISEQEKDEIIMNNRLYSYEMAQTRALLNQKTIRSPINGVVVETLLDPGEYVGEEPILNIAQLDPLYVEAALPARYFGAVVIGSQAEIMLEAPLRQRYQAEVKIVDRVLDAASNTFGVRLVLDNPDYLVPAGLKCSIRFAL